MTRPLCIALMLGLAAPHVVQGQPLVATDASQAANRVCADLLFARPEAVMTAARDAQVEALAMHTPGSAAREGHAQSITGGIAELQRLRAALGALAVPEGAATDWQALLDEVDFRIRLAGNRAAVLRGETQDIILATDSPVPPAAQDSLAQRLASQWPDCGMALHADGPPEGLRPYIHQVNGICAGIFTAREGPEGRAAGDRVLDAVIAAREGQLHLPDAELAAALRYQEQHARTAATALAALAAEAGTHADSWAWLQDRQRQYADFHAERLRVVTSDPTDPSAGFLAVQRPPQPARSIDDLGLGITQCRNIAL